MRRNVEKEVKEALDNGIVFLFAINPSYAYRWAINNNAYTLGLILKKMEEIIRAEQDNKYNDLVKYAFFFIVLLIGAAIAIFIILNAFKTGGTPSIVPQPPQIGGGNIKI